MIHTDGVRIHGFGPSSYRPYAPSEQAVLRAALGRWPHEAGVAQAAELVERAHGEVLQDLIAQTRMDLIGFHGQTLAHEPAGRGTHQAGRGAVLADLLGVPVVHDLRSADVSLGGQGAPLAPFYHFACARYVGFTAPVAFLNLGGVGNVTFVDPTAAAPEAEGALLAFDTGPANAPMNDLMSARLGVPFDQDGALAAVGEIQMDVVERFLAHRYFQRIPPKSLDRDDFPELLEQVAHLGDADAAATLMACACGAVASAMQHMPRAPGQLVVCGGGRRNQVFMSQLAALLHMPVYDVDQFGLDGDMLEAQAFGHLAVRVLRGLPTSGPSTTGGAANVGGGQIARPRGLDPLVMAAT